MESRWTFRSKQTAIAWQKKIRDEKRDNYKGVKFWESIDLSLKNAIVREVNRPTAQKIILEYEWLGDMAITDKFYGIFFEEYCGGVICINTNGVAIHGHTKFEIKQNELSYFARGACPFWTPTGTASKLLSYALKFERQRGAKAAIAFVDTDAGEYGTIYQATNWLCIGRGSKSKQFVKGTRVLDNRTFCGMAARRNMSTPSFARLLVHNGWIEQIANPKYRYAYILAVGDEYKRIYNNIKELLVDYPKRPDQNAAAV